MAYTPRLKATTSDMDKLATPDTVKARPAQDEKVPGCDQCFPDGWPSASTSVGCEHGMWVRDLPEASIEVDF